MLLYHARGGKGERDVLAHKANGTESRSFYLLPAFKDVLQIAALHFLMLSKSQIFAIHRPETSRR
jgi:hypothetical protein